MIIEKNQDRPLYRQTKIEDYDKPAHIFALDYYRPGSGGDDDFSRKEVWFYYLGDDKLKEEFTQKMDKMLEDLFVKNSVDWDYFTLAPSYQKGSLNSNMQDLCRKISEKKTIEYRQVLRRYRGVNESEEFDSIKQKVINQQNSIDITEEVEGKNIIILDNVSVSGVPLAFLTKILLDAGAERVCCLVLGVTNHKRAVERLDKGITASTAMKDVERGDHG